MNGETSKVSFGLYAAEDLVAADGTKIPKDGLLEIAQCDAEGKAIFTTDVPVGSKLYVKEYATDADYLPSDTTYPVEFVYAGQEVAAVIITVNNGEVIQNELIRGCVEGLKKDEDGNAVAGAEFGLFWADATEFTKENAILIATSDDAGVFRFENLPALKFIIKELSAPVQFVLSEETFEVEITEDEQVITIEAVNKFITGNVTANDMWLEIYRNIICGYNSVAHLSDIERKAIPYVILANQFVCVAWFAGQDKYAELFETNKKMTLWLIVQLEELKDI